MSGYIVIDWLWADYSGMQVVDLSEEWGDEPLMVEMENLGMGVVHHFTDWDTVVAHVNEQLEFACHGKNAQGVYLVHPKELNLEPSEVLSAEKAEELYEAEGEWDGDFVAFHMQDGS